MDESEQKKPMWQKKRRNLLALATARAAKMRKLSSDTDVEPTASRPLDPKPGPSRTIETTAGQSPSALTDGESSARESDSESERGDSSSDEEGEFDAQEAFDDFIVSLPLLERKTLSVLLMHSFRTRQKMSVSDAAREAASISGYNERTVRRYSKEFFDNRGRFPDSRHTKL